MGADARADHGGPALYRRRRSRSTGNTVVNAEALGPLFKIRTGDTYSQKDIRKGLETARELYGSGGYFEFTAYPDLKPREPEPDERGTASPSGEPIVDVTIRVDEGKQYFVNRITFVGQHAHA